MFSQIYVSAVVAILAQVLPHLGVAIGSEELTTLVSNIITVGAALWVIIRRYKQGDITVVGSRKS
jgi:hypothetical protein